MSTEARGRDPVSELGDPHPWRAAIVLGLLAIAAGMLASTVLPVVLGRGGWWTPGDAWISLRAAHYVPQGAWPLIYETGTKHDIFDGGPLLPLVLAPVAYVSDLFHLREGYPFAPPYPSAWIVYGPYVLASAIPLLYAVRALATEIGLGARRLLLQGAVLIVAFVPIALYGHVEDAIALTLLLLAFRDLLAGRELRGALLVAAAIAFKQWSLLAVPVFVAISPAPVRLRVAVRSLVPPALLEGAFLAMDYPYASRALLHTPTFASLGHSALWISPSADYLSSVPARAGAILLAVVVGWRMRDQRDPSRVLAAVGVILLARFFFESVVHAYYLAPGITFLLVSERAWRRIVTKTAIAAALLLAFPLHPDRQLWWAGVYVLGAALLVPPARRLLARPGPRGDPGAAPREADDPGPRAVLSRS